MGSWFLLNCINLFLSLNSKTMPPKGTIKSFFTASEKRSCQHIENETAADEEGRGRADKNGMSNLFSASLPSFYFALPLLHKL